MRFDLNNHRRLWGALRVNVPAKQADFFTDLVYMPALEGGHSQQAPSGMVDINLDNGAREFDRALDRAIDAIADGRDPDRALTGAVNDAALFLLREVVADTPIDTGRARASWQIKLADGTRHDSVGLGLTPNADLPGIPARPGRRRRRRPGGPGG